MPQFVVDATSLLSLRDTLGRLHDELTGMHVSIYGYDGDLGSGPLEGELEQFCGRWHWAVSVLGGEIDNLMSRLVQAADAYRRIDGHAVPGGGSGTTVIGGGSGSGSGSGSGTTVIGGGPSGGSRGSDGGSGTTTIG